MRSIVLTMCVVLLLSSSFAIAQEVPVGSPTLWQYFPSWEQEDLRPYLVLNEVYIFFTYTGIDNDEEVISVATDLMNEYQMVDQIVYIDAEHEAVQTVLVTSQTAPRSALFRFEQPASSPEELLQRLGGIAEKEYIRFVSPVFEREGQRFILTQFGTVTFSDDPLFWSSDPRALKIQELRDALELALGQYHLEIRSLDRDSSSALVALQDGYIHILFAMAAARQEVMFIEASPVLAYIDVPFVMTSTLRPQGMEEGYSSGSIGTPMELHVSIEAKAGVTIPVDQFKEQGFFHQQIIIGVASEGAFVPLPDMFRTIGVPSVETIEQEDGSSVLLITTPLSVITPGTFWLAPIVIEATAVHPLTGSTMKRSVTMRILDPLLAPGLLPDDASDGGGPSQRVVEVIPDQLPFHGTGLLLMAIGTILLGSFVMQVYGEQIRSFLPQGAATDVESTAFDRCFEQWSAAVDQMQTVSLDELWHHVHTVVRPSLAGLLFGEDIEYFDRGEAKIQSVLSSSLLSTETADCLGELFEQAERSVFGRRPITASEDDREALLAALHAVSSECRDHNNDVGV